MGKRLRMTSCGSQTVGWSSVMYICDHRLDSLGFLGL